MALPNLAQRLISAVVALPLIGALILWDEAWGFGALMLVVAAIGLHEYGAITLAGAGARLRFGVIVLGVGLAAGLYALPAYAVVWVLGAFVGTAGWFCSTPARSPRRAPGWASRRSASSIWACCARRWRSCSATRRTGARG